VVAFHLEAQNNKTRQKKGHHKCDTVLEHLAEVVEENLEQLQDEEGGCGEGSTPKDILFHFFPVEMGFAWL